MSYMNKILCGDALEQLRLLQFDSVHSCVTIPPYYGLRDYGIIGQFGIDLNPAFCAMAQRRIDNINEGGICVGG